MDTNSGDHVERIDRTTVRAGRHGSRFGLSVSGAGIATVVLAATVLGAGGFLAGNGPRETREATPAPAAWNDGADPTDKPVVGPTDKPVVEPTDKPVVEPSEKPVVEPTEKPAPKPNPTKPPTQPLGLWVGLKNGHPVLEWAACTGIEFDYYKVVRSTNSSVAWPTGDGDELIAVVSPNDSRRAWDGSSPTGMRLYYRVFCVRWTDAGYLVKRATAVASILVPAAPAPTPTPEPKPLAFEAVAGEAGIVHLSWAACPAEGYVYTKVLRSKTSENPSYLPWTDGTEILAVMGDPADTAWDDTDVASGETVWYRVQCIGSFDGSKLVLADSAVAAVTVP